MSAKNPTHPSSHFKVHGLDCAEEVSALKREVGPVVGGEGRLSFDLLNSRMTVAGGPPVVPSDVILRAVSQAGLRAEVWHKGTTAETEIGFWRRQGRTVLTGVSGLCTLAGFLAHVAIAGSVRLALGSEVAGAAHHVPPAAKVLYAVGILSGVWLVLPKAWLAVRRLRPEMNLLMTVAVVGAVGIGEWFEASTVAFLFALSLTLESWSVGRARRAIEALLDLSPATVRLRREDGREEQVPPDEVPVGC